MLIALPVRVIYLSVLDLEWCFGLVGAGFWQITCIVNMSRVSEEKKCQNNQREKFLG